jgi:Zn finger protein HypA/HybF involved in hydrogenase expression
MTTNAKQINVIVRKVWEITCSNCDKQFNVYHNSWSALVCPACHVELRK